MDEREMNGQSFDERNFERMDNQGQRPQGLEQSGQRTTGYRTQAQRTMGQKPAGQRTTEQSVAEQRLTGQRATEQRSTGQRLTEQRVSGQRPTEKRAAGRRPAEQRAAGQRPESGRPTDRRRQTGRPTGQRPAGQRPEGQRAAGQRPTGQRPSGQRMRKSSRARRQRRNQFIRMFLLIVILIVAVGGFAVWHRYGPSKEKADLKNYYGVSAEDDLAVIVNNKVIKNEDGSPVGKIFDGEAYVEYSVVRKNINSRFYWDPNESIMLYTLPNGNVSVAVGSKDYTEITEKKSETYTILKTEGRKAYIAVSFIQQYTNMDFVVYKKPSRVAITCEWNEVETALLKRDTAVRYQGGVKSPVLTEAKKSDKVVVLEDEKDWKKIATEDGFIGYVKTNSLKKIAKEVKSRDFNEQEYTNISVNHTVNMAWHNVDNAEANNYVLQTIAGTKGLTTIAPTWFSIADTDGNINSLASTEYVNYAHQSRLDVWAVLRDFHGGINSFEETYEVLSYTSKRERLINQVIAAALQSGIDGINLDFELISLECGEHYVQFVRELAVKCRQNGLVFSIDNYVPQPYNEHYDLEEQGIMADYVVLMGYDEHTEGSLEAGSVASYNYVKDGIENMLKDVPHEKLIAGVPLYTRQWFEVPKTEEELAAEEGTEAAEYSMKVSSTALGMDEAQAILQENAIQPEWDDTAKQNYAQWDADGGTYKIWLEDAASLEEKLKLIKSENLAGVAEWKLGWENSGVWDLILQYVN